MRDPRDGYKEFEELWEVMARLLGCVEEMWFKMYDVAFAPDEAGLY